MSEYCGVNPESVNSVGNAPRGGGYQNYGNTYKLNWRNHPNFSWGGNQQNQHQGQIQFRPQGSGQHYNHQGQGSQQTGKSGNMGVEDMLKQLMTDQAKLVADVRHNQLATQNLEKQLGQ